DQPIDTRSVSWSELCCPLEERRGSRRPASLPGSCRGALEVGRDRFIRKQRRVRSMPRPTVRVAIHIGRVGESFVDTPPLGDGGCPVDRRPNKRMTKAHPRPDDQCLGSLSTIELVGFEAEGSGGSEQ